MFQTYPSFLVRSPVFQKYAGTLHVIWREKVLGKRIPVPAPDVEWLGTDYGRFIIPKGIVGEDWIVYSGGVGEDISFDLELIERFGCHVHAFDPTPRAVEFVEKAAGQEPRFHFTPVAIWKEADVLRFYAPQNPDHVSHSVVNLQATEDYFEAECDSLSGLMKRLGHDRIDLLKLNIEGAEYEVLECMIERDPGVRVLCVAFDQPMPIWRTHRMICQLAGARFVLCAIDGWKMTFVREWNG